MTAELQEFTQFQLDRYQRQIRMDGFGIEAQHALRRSRAVISRCGGVGGAAAAYLARAGIGALTIAHGGVLVPEYLNRMPLIGTADVGRRCVEAFQDTLHHINPDVALRVVSEYVSDDNVTDIASGADVIVDGAPLFEERFALNSEALRRGIPMVSGAMYDTEGYVTTIIPGQTPCLRCIVTERPDYWDNIKVFPAIGPGPAIVGAMLAMEAIKVLTGFGESLQNRLWFFDLRTNMTRLLSVVRRPDCPACADAASVPQPRRGE